MRCLAVAVLCSLCCCTTVNVERYPDGLDVGGGGGSHVKALVQVKRSTVTIFLDYVDVVDIGLELTLKTLEDETRAAGGVPRLLYARTSTRGGWRALACLLVCVNSTELAALAVEERPVTSASSPDAPSPR